MRRCLMAVTYEGVAKQTRQIIHHHAVLRCGLERRVGTLCEAVESGVPFERQMRILRNTLPARSCPMRRRRNAPSTPLRLPTPAAASWSAR